MSSVGEHAFVYWNDSEKAYKPLPNLTFNVPSGKKEDYKVKIANGAGNSETWPDEVWTITEISE